MMHSSSMPLSSAHRVSHALADSLKEVSSDVPENILYDDMSLAQGGMSHPEAYTDSSSSLEGFTSVPLQGKPSPSFQVSHSPLAYSREVSERSMYPHASSHSPLHPASTSEVPSVLTEEVLMPKMSSTGSEQAQVQSPTFVPVSTDTAFERYTQQEEVHQFVTVNTSRFSELTIQTKDVIELKLPILGFEDLRQFILLPHGEEGESPFFWLQSVEDGDIAFVVTHPVLWHIPYEFSIQDDIVSALHLDTLPAPVENHILVLCIVNIPHHSPSEPSINLRAPIVMNQRERIGGQVVLQDDTLPIRGNLLSYMKDTATAAS
ncbi:MAG: flagellar assembly protein FliW [Vampirovibrionales bacterium]